MAPYRMETRELEPAVLRLPRDGGGLGIQPLTVLRETGLLRTNLVLLKDYYRFFYQAGLNAEITGR